jgi:hypothetical protein
MQDDSDGTAPKRRGVLKAAAAMPVASLFPTSVGSVRAQEQEWPTGVHVAYGEEPQTMLNVGWTGPAVENAFVEYGPAGEELTLRAEATPTALPGRHTFAYQATMDELDAGSEFQYRAVMNDRRSDTFRVETAPAATEGFRVTAYADHGVEEDINPFSRNPGDTARRNVELVDSLDPDFHIAAGDISYADGRPETWDRYFDRFEYFTATTPFMTQAGNHELEVSFGLQQYDERLNALMPSGELGSLISETLPQEDVEEIVGTMEQLIGDLVGEELEVLTNALSDSRTGVLIPDDGFSLLERWYDFRYDNTLFVGLHSDFDPCQLVASGPQGFQCPEELSTLIHAFQTAYLERTLEAADVDPRIEWVVPYFHHGPWQAANHPSREGLKAVWGTLFDEYDVPLVLLGHNHCYQRTTPTTGDEITETGVTWVTNGTGGISHYSVDDAEAHEWLLVADNNRYGSTVLDIDDSSIDVRYETIDGETFDEFSIVKDDNGRPTQAGFELEESPTSMTTTGSRTQDTSVYTPGDTGQVGLSVETEAAVRFRDRLPAEWTYLDGDGDVTGAAEAGTQFVALGETDSLEATYTATAPSTLDQSQTYPFGPVEALVDGEWVTVPGTKRTVFVLAVGESIDGPSLTGTEGGVL